MQTLTHWIGGERLDGTAYLPRGLSQVVHGDREAVEALPDADLA